MPKIRVVNLTNKYITRGNQQFPAKCDKELTVSDYQYREIRAMSLLKVTLADVKPIQPANDVDIDVGLDQGGEQDAEETIETEKTLEEMTVPELKELAKAEGVKNFYNMNKEGLLEALK